MSAIVYPPVGKCIYCGATRYWVDRAKLGLEHIVPFCIDGGHELPEASCRRCERITGGLETALFGDKGTYMAARHQSGARTRGKTKKKGERTIRVFVGEGANKVAYDFPGDEAPRYVTSVEGNQPPVLSGGTPFTDQGKINLNVRVLTPGAAQRLGQPVGAPGLRLDLLLRFLAKVGHSFAIAEVGLANYSPLLLGVILGGETRLPWGAIGGSGFKGFRDMPYRIGLSHKDVDGVRFIVVDFQMFSTLGLVEYRIVPGMIDSETHNAVKRQQMLDVVAIEDPFAVPQGRPVHVHTFKFPDSGIKFSR